MSALNQSSVQNTATVKPYKQQPNTRPAGEWERPSSSGGHGDSAPPAGVLSRDSYQANDRQQQQQLHPNRDFHGTNQQKDTEPRTEWGATLSPSPVQSLDADLDVPMETDIDDFQEDDGSPNQHEAIHSELPCLALPVTVLETDIDSSLRAERGSVEEAEEEEEGSKELEEFFPHNSEEEVAADSWRTIYPSTEHNTDSLDR